MTNRPVSRSFRCVKIPLREFCAALHHTTESIQQQYGTRVDNRAPVAEAHSTDGGVRPCCQIPFLVSHADGSPRCVFHDATGFVAPQGTYPAGEGDVFLYSAWYL